MSRWPFRRSLAPGQLRSLEDEIREEMELYLELRAEELAESEGMSLDEARREAERRFGDRTEIERRVRRERARGNGRDDGRMMMGQVRQDVGYALRSLRKSPGFALVAILTLGVALAGNAVLFGVLDEAVLQALPFPEAEELVFVNGYHLSGGERGYRMASVPEFLDWRERSRALEPVAAAFQNGWTLARGEGAERVTAEIVSDGYFDLLRGEPLLGRLFTPLEAGTPSEARVAILSQGLWERSFGGTPAAVGSTVRLDEVSYTIVGVMPGEFRGVGLDVDLWLPLGVYPSAFEARGGRFLPVMGRLAPGFTLEQAQAELDAIARDLQAAYPRAHEDRWAEVVPFRDGYLGTTGQLLWILFGAGVLLLALAGANVANLLLVRTHARTRELTVRRALGAGRGRVTAQLLTESVVLAVLGGAVGLVLAAWGMEALVPALPEGVLPAFVEPSVSGRVFLVTFLSLGAVGAAAGLLPAWAGGRLELATSLREGGRGSAGAGGRARHLFVVAQVGLAILLLVGAGLLSRSLRAQLAVDPGLRLHGVHVFRVQPPSERYPGAEEIARYREELLAGLQAIPGVEAASAGSDFPFRGRSSGAYIYRPDAPEERIRYHHHSVAPGYLELLGVELRAGRTLRESDVPDGPGVAVVTEAMVRRVFPELAEPAAAVGRGIYFGNPSDPENLAEIVGVVEDVRYRGLTQDMMAAANSPDVFFSVAQLPARTMEVAVASDRTLANLLPEMREVASALDPATPLYQPQSLREAYEAQTATPRFAAFLMGLFSALALALACVGIYGVLAFTVGERTREIAVRRALGAQAGSVARSVVWQGVRLGLVGVALGAGTALLAARVMEGILFQVEPVDPATYAGVSVLMVAVLLAAATIPAVRAARKSPLEALGGE